LPGRQNVDLAIVGHQIARLAGVRKESDGRQRVDQHEVSHAGELMLG